MYHCLLYIRRQSNREVSGNGPWVITGMEELCPRKKEQAAGWLHFLCHTHKRVFLLNPPPLYCNFFLTLNFWNGDNSTLETAFIYSYLLWARTASQGPVFQLPIFQWKSQKHVELIPTPRNKFISHTDNLRNIFYRQSQKHVDLFNDNLAAMLPLLHLPMPTLETGSSSNENLRNVLILNRMQCYVSNILRWQS